MYQADMYPGRASLVLLQVRCVSRDDRLLAVTRSAGQGQRAAKAVQVEGARGEDCVREAGQRKRV